MSRAFVKETDDAPEPPPRRRGVPVPVDVPNYITTAGVRALRAEVEAGGATDDRAHEIADHLATAVVMEAPADRARVGFGATVIVEDEAGASHRYRIVGAVEAAPKQGDIYWQSPIALALHDAEVGDSITLPKGDVEIVSIDYA